MLLKAGIIVSLPSLFACVLITQCSHLAAVAQLCLQQLHCPSQL